MYCVLTDTYIDLTFPIALNTGCFFGFITDIRGGIVSQYNNDLTFAWCSDTSYFSSTKIRIICNKANAQAVDCLFISFS